MTIDEFVVDAICEVFASDFEGKVFKNVTRPVEFHPPIVPEKELIGVSFTPTGVPLIGKRRLLFDRDFLVKTCLHPKVLEYLFEDETEGCLCDWTPIKVNKRLIEENSSFWTLIEQYKGGLNLLGNGLYSGKNVYELFELQRGKGENSLLFNNCVLTAYSTIWEAEIALRVVNMAINHREVFFRKAPASTPNVRSLLWVFSETVLPMLKCLPKQYRHLNFELIS